MISNIGPKALALAIAVPFAATLSPAYAGTTFRPLPGSRGEATYDASRGADAYIYVSDAYNQKVYVYPVGVANPAPINAMSVVGSPTGMAVAKNGNVYVAVSNTSGQDSIFIYSPGGKTLLGSIGSSAGIASIRDVAFDSAGDLLVSCLRTSDNKTGIVTFAPNTIRTIGWDASPTSQSYGITLDSKDDAYLDTGLYGEALEYQRARAGSGYQVAGVMGAPTAGGLVFSGKDLIMTGGTGLWIFTPSSPSSKYKYTRTALINYGVGHGTGYPARGNDGTLYIPVFGDSGGHSTVHEVRIYRENSDYSGQFSNYSTITTSLEYPAGVAVGPR